MPPYLLSAWALCCTTSFALECADGCWGRAGGLEDGAILLQRNAEAEPGFAEAARLDLQQAGTSQRVKSSFAKHIANRTKSEVKAALQQTKEFWAKEARKRYRLEKRMKARTSAMREAWREDGKEKKLRREREKAARMEDDAAKDTGKSAAQPPKVSEVRPAPKPLHPAQKDDAAKATGKSAAQPQKAAAGKPTPKPAHPAQKDAAAKATGTSAAQPRKAAEARPAPKPAHPAQKDARSTVRLAKPALTHLPLKNVSHSYKKPGIPAQKRARESHLPAKAPVKPAQSHLPAKAPVKPAQK